MSDCGRESASNAPIAWQSLLAADDGRVHRLLGRYPDHFRSLYSMAGTIEDRRSPDGVYFGQTEIARRGYGISVTVDRGIPFRARRGMGADAVAAAGDGAVVCGAWRDFLAAGYADD